MKIILSGGGTAGHINPAIAVAEVLTARGHEVLFVGAQGKMEMERVPAAGYKIVGLPIVGLQRRLTIRNLALPLRMLQSTHQAKKIIRDFSPDVVVGFGGYASGPIVRAAQKRKIPTVLQEQNSFAGLTNRLLARRAAKICVAYEGMEKHFPAERIVHTGNPLRGRLSQLPPKAQGYTHFDLDPQKKTILIIGGSLGTRTLNEMVAQIDTLAPGVQLLWQCGRYYHQEMLQRAQRHNPRAYIDQMEKAYAIADVVITRAGALTISELQLIGRGTIFVPSPNVSEDHQTHNARSLESQGAGVIVTDERAAAEAIPLAYSLLADPERLESMAAAQRAMGRPEAAREIARIILETSRQSQ